jgi:hypothetical protein
MTMRYLAGGSVYDIALVHGVAVSTVYAIVGEVAHVSGAQQSIPFKNESPWDFARSAPSSLGAIPYDIDGYSFGLRSRRKKNAELGETCNQAASSVAASTSLVSTCKPFVSQGVVPWSLNHGSRIGQRLRILPLMDRDEFTVQSEGGLPQGASVGNEERRPDSLLDGSNHFDDVPSSERRSREPDTVRWRLKARVEQLGYHRPWLARVTLEDNS